MVFDLRRDEYLMFEFGYPTSVITGCCYSFLADRPD